MAGLVFAEVIMVVVVLLVRLSIFLLGIFALLRVFAPERLQHWSHTLTQWIEQWRSHNDAQKG